MNPLPATDLRSNIGTYAVPNHALPCLSHLMTEAMPAEPFDPDFKGQYLQTTYFDTKDFDLLKARRGKDRYLTLRVRCYSPPETYGSSWPAGTYALSAKTEGSFSSSREGRC